MTRLIFLGVALGTSMPALTAQAQFAVRSIDLQRADKGNAALTPTQINQTFFGLARCQCGERIRIKIEITPDASATGNVRLVSGNDCLTSDSLIDQSRCRVLLEDRIRNWTSTQYPIVNTNVLMTRPNGSCEEVTAAKGRVAVYTSDGGDKYTERAGIDFGVDTIPPPPPVKGETPPECGEGLVAVYFDAPRQSGATGRIDTDVQRMQVLCEQLDPATGRWLAPNLGLSPSYTSMGTMQTEKICPAFPADPAGDEFSVDGAGEPLQISGGIATLHPAYICSAGLDTSTGSVQVTGLENGVTYRFYAVTIDYTENASNQLVALGESAPCPSEDLWERYLRSGGQATGCRVGHRGQDVGAAWLLLLLVGGWGMLWRRRYRCRQPLSWRAR